MSDRQEYAWVDLYHQVKRRPDEGTATAAARVHAQACGFVAYVYNIHPDAVGRAVRESLDWGKE